MPSTSVWLLRSEARYRAALGLALLLGVLALGFVAIMFVVSFAWPSTAIATPEQHMIAGHGSDFQTNQPVYFSKGDFWLVKQPDGSFLALYARDTRLSYLPDGAVRCPVRWLPDFVVGNAQAGVKGWFKANCTGSDFRLNGSIAFGPSPRGLDQHPAWVTSSGDVVVNIPSDRIQLGRPR